MRNLSQQESHWLLEGLSIQNKPKAIAKAAKYTLSRKKALMLFLENANVTIDNNPAENAILPNVIGQKNWLFSVSEAGTQANAIRLSLAETAKAN